jgi:hypothetical protein
MASSFVEGFKPELRKEYSLEVHSQRVEPEKPVSETTRAWAKKLLFRQKHSIESYPEWYKDEAAKGPRALLEKAALIASLTREKSDLEIFGVLVAELTKSHNIAGDVREILNEELIKKLIS